LVQAELEVLRKVAETPEKPYTVVLGGSKVSDKLGVIEALAPKVDSLVIGGGMCFTFLAAKGYDVGASLLQEEMIDTCKDLLDLYGEKIVLPTDVVVADKFAADAENKVVDATEIPEGWMGLDIGSASAE
ncbi:phosphoglycerate kinase, partial [Escherichia coli]|nr:phosphoglycerate kinase [Escherichia coli]